jgi:hypothetical protein
VGASLALVDVNLQEESALPVNTERNLTMREREIHNFEMLKRVDDHGEADAASFPAASLGGQLFAAISAVVEELEEYAAAQSAGGGAARSSTQEKRKARESVRRKMSAISSTADSMESEFPGAAKRFRLPRNNGDQVLINSARAFLEAATPLKEDFLRRELPATFLEDLTAAIAAFETAVNNQNLNNERRVSATAAIREAVERGVKLVRKLDPIVRNKYRDDEAKLAAWESAKHVERAPKRTKAARKPAPES